jgi:hypothetical protein
MADIIQKIWVTGLKMRLLGDVDLLRCTLPILQSRIEQPQSHSEIYIFQIFSLFLFTLLETPASLIIDHCQSRTVSVFLVHLLADA